MRCRVASVYDQRDRASCILLCWLIWQSLTSTLRRVTPRRQQTDCMTSWVVPWTGGSCKRIRKRLLCITNAAYSVIRAYRPYDWIRDSNQKGDVRIDTYLDLVPPVLIRTLGDELSPSGTVVGSISRVIRINTIRYDTIEEINVDSKAEYTA